MSPIDLLRGAVELNDAVDVCRSLGVTPWKALEAQRGRTPEQLAVIAFRALLLRG